MKKRKRCGTVHSCCTHVAVQVAALAVAVVDGESRVPGGGGWQQLNSEAEVKKHHRGHGDTETRAEYNIMEHNIIKYTLTQGKIVSYV